MSYVHWSKHVVAVSDAPWSPVRTHIAPAHSSTKTPCRTITLNKSLPPMAIRPHGSSLDVIPLRCLNKINTTTEDPETIGNGMPTNRVVKNSYNFSHAENLSRIERVIE